MEVCQPVVASLGAQGKGAIPHLKGRFSFFRRSCPAAAHGWWTRDNGPAIPASMQIKGYGQHAHCQSDQTWPGGVFPGIHDAGERGSSFPAPPQGTPPGCSGSTGGQARHVCAILHHREKTRPQAVKALFSGTFAACRRFPMFQTASGPYFFTRRALIRSPSGVTYTVRHVA